MDKQDKPKTYSAADVTVYVGGEKITGLLPCDVSHIGGQPPEIIARLDVSSRGMEQLKTLSVDAPEPNLRRPLTPWPSDAGIPIHVDDAIPDGEVWAFDKDGKRVDVLRIEV